MRLFPPSCKNIIYLPYPCYISPEISGKTERPRSLPLLSHPTTTSPTTTLILEGEKRKATVMLTSFLWQERSLQAPFLGFQWEGQNQEHFLIRTLLKAIDSTASCRPYFLHRFQSLSPFLTPSLIARSKRKQFNVVVLTIIS